MNQLTSKTNQGLSRVWNQEHDDFRSYLSDAYPDMMAPALDLAVQTAQYDYVAAGSPIETVTGLLPPPEQLRASVGWALSEGDKETGLALLHGATQKHIFNAHRDTTLANVHNERGARWARVGAPDACPFCRMLTTRGHVYRTQQSAGVGNSYHDHCKCSVAVWRPGEHMPRVPEYMNKWVDEYEEAVKLTGGSYDPKDLRRAYVELQREGRTKSQYELVGRTRKYDDEAYLKMSPAEKKRERARRRRAEQKEWEEAESRHKREEEMKPKPAPAPKPKRTKYDDEAYQKMSPAEKKRERARRRRELKRKEQAYRPEDRPKTPAPAPEPTPKKAVPKKAPKKAVPKKAKAKDSLDARMDSYFENIPEDKRVTSDQLVEITREFTDSLSEAEKHQLGNSLYKMNKRVFMEADRRAFLHNNPIFEKKMKLRKLSRSETVADSRILVNPNRTQKGIAYRANCQRVAPSYEMRRRGYNVKAGPRTESNGLNDTRIAGLFREKDGTFRRTSKGMPVDEAEKQIQELPEGARGFMMVEWKNKAAHIFNWEVKNGKMQWLEGQMYPKYAPQVIRTHYREQISETGPRQGVKWMRTDDLIPNFEAFRAEKIFE